jgi:hypothetical protein
MAGEGFDWLAFLAGFGTALLLMFLLRSRRRPDLDQPPAPPPHIPDDLRRAALKLRAEGRIIEAIKLVRDRTGCDLKTAKEAVERLS